MTNATYGGTPLVAGSLIGLRAFSVDRDGRLYGVTHQVPFRPGDNEAQCLGGPWFFHEGHQIAMVSCQCGYYAFHDGTNHYVAGHDYLGDRCAALIEGFGHVTVGSRGFRASKARLVALVLPIDGQRGDFEGIGFVVMDAGYPVRTDYLWPYVDLVRANYPGVPVYPTVADALAEHPLSDVTELLKEGEAA